MYTCVRVLSMDQLQRPCKPPSFCYHLAHRAGQFLPFGSVLILADWKDSAYKVHIIKYGVLVPVLSCWVFFAFACLPHFFFLGGGAHDWKSGSVTGVCVCVQIKLPLGVVCFVEALLRLLCTCSLGIMLSGCIHQLN